MTEPKDRLKIVRTEAGFKSPSDAARILPDININTLISHENGNRAISRKAAEKYADAFGRTAGWILFGEDQVGEDFESMYIRLNDQQKKQVLAFMSFMLSGQSNP